MANNPTILNVENLSVKFDDRHEALKNISFFIQRGDVLAIIGPNGSGKSVLLRTLLGLIPYSGKIEWASNSKISYLPQKLYIDKNLPLSVWEFFKLKSKNKKEIIEILKLVGFISENYIKHHILNQRLGWLSGGQFQRVMIAWAIIDSPDILLFDEPTSGIDIEGEETIYNLLKKLKDQRNLTIVLVSHDLNVVYKYADNVICINKAMVCYGVPSEVLDPAALVSLYGGQASFYKHEHHHG